MEEFTYQHQLRPFQQKMTGPFMSTPSEWISWTKLAKQKTNDDYIIDIPLKPGVYEVRAIFENEKFKDSSLLRDRLYIGKSSGDDALGHQSLDGRIKKLLKGGNLIPTTSVCCDTPKYFSRVQPTEETLSRNSPIVSKFVGGNVKLPNY